MCSTECHSSYMHNGFTDLVANHAADGLSYLASIVVYGSCIMYTALSGFGKIAA